MLWLFAFVPPTANEREAFKCKSNFCFVPRFPGIGPVDTILKEKKVNIQKDKKKSSLVGMRILKLSLKTLYPDLICKFFGFQK
jgi:hypothetical protein